MDLYSAFRSEDTEVLHRRTHWVWIDGFSSGVWKWECFRTVECQQVESSRWTEQQQKKRDGQVGVYAYDESYDERRSVPSGRRPYFLASIISRTAVIDMA